MLESSLQFIEFSVVSITHDLVLKVSDRTNRTVESVENYLSTDWQDDALLRAFLFFGVAPYNKRFCNTHRGPLPQRLLNIAFD
jgi:hypothetical protein